VGGAAMKEIIRRTKHDTETETKERCFIIEVSNTIDDPELSIARARVEPGITTRWHRLKGTIERYVILQGKGLVEVGSLKQEIGPGDVVIIPPLCPQRIKNIGKDDLIFYCICTPRFMGDNYEDIEGN
jgi:mannose-6-phosphate isomerase-like protein (cupin superfamily)